MDTFLKVLRYLFYGFAALCILFLVLYKMSDPLNEDYFRYFIYSGIVAIGCSILRFILRMV